MSNFGLICICKRKIVLDEPTQRKSFGHLCVRTCWREHAKKLRCKACGRRGRLIIVDEFGDEIRRERDLNLPDFDRSLESVETDHAAVPAQHPVEITERVEDVPSLSPSVAQNGTAATPQNVPLTTRAPPHHARPSQVARTAAPQFGTPEEGNVRRCPDCDIPLRSAVVHNFIASACPRCGETF